MIARIPEGFARRSVLNKRIKIPKKGAIDKILQESTVKRVADVYYDSTRLTEDEAEQRDLTLRPTLPAIHQDGHMPEATIVEQVEMREYYLREIGNEAALELINRLDATVGYMPQDELATNEDEEAALVHLLKDKLLRQIGTLIYDPLRLGGKTMQIYAHETELKPVRDQVIAYLMEQPGYTAPREDLARRFEWRMLIEVIQSGGFAEFKVTTKRKKSSDMIWVRLKEADTAEARKVAEETVKIPDEDWEEALQLCGDVLRPGARDGSTRRIKVVARSYTINRATKRLNIRQKTLEEAIKYGAIQVFEDPEERLRIPAYEIEQAFHDAAQAERINAFEQLSVKDIALVSGFSYSTIRRRLQKAGINRGLPTWGDVKGRWGLPDNLYDYYTTLEQKKIEWREERDARLEEERRRIREEQEQERREREELRDRLVASFPTWKHEDRNEQRIFLHIGPPNSGKTHDSLNRLVDAGSGWYLAPLRLLAYEIFDRLNQRGVPCNLLTGEEYIPVDGATFTAATIEMFNPAESGECVVIDEAQLLADPDRGWAWTRAMMQAQAPEIHMIGPPTARKLIQKMASAAAIPIEPIEHERLSPIKVADTHWDLAELPPHTILVAFSRRMVLELKTQLEEDLHRTVSVVYGSLPPEVRRKQADRFANGETEICVATDAVGMGLNLPADRVCFYEIQKYDGKEVRELTASEVQQIGGRAGRYGIRESGEVGTIDRRDIKRLRQLFHANAKELTHARVAPTVEDLELIPGSLAEKLVQWAMLESIPDSLKGVVKTADLDQRIELARMLTDAEVDHLGLATAVQLINAPTRQQSRSYWYSCAQAILRNRPMPPPPDPPSQIDDGSDLELMESCISCADIYLWLSSRREFKLFGVDRQEVHALRTEWSLEIDQALLRNIDTKRRCPNCGKPLPFKHRHRLCDDCFFMGFQEQVGGSHSNGPNGNGRYGNRRRRR